MRCILCSSLLVEPPPYRCDDPDCEMSTHELSIGLARKLDKLRQVPAKPGRPIKQPCGYTPGGQPLWRCTECLGAFVAEDMARRASAANGLHSWCLTCKRRNDKQATAEYRRRNAR